MRPGDIEISVRAEREGGRADDRESKRFQEPARAAIENEHGGIALKGVDIAVRADFHIRHIVDESGGAGNADFRAGRLVKNVHLQGWPANGPVSDKGVLRPRFPADGADQQGGKQRRRDSKLFHSSYSFPLRNLPHRSGGFAQSLQRDCFLRF